MISASVFKGKKVGVFGLGKSGMPAVKSLLEGGATVFAWDDHEASVLSIKDLESDQLMITAYDSWPWSDLASVILSPGVPLHHPVPHRVVIRARQSKVEIIADIEVLYRSYPKVDYVGITGTNGKSTTTSLVYHILKHSQKSVQVGGNIGIGALELEPPRKGEVYVLELSSYQLDLVDQMHVSVSVLLNITPDHLDRHLNMEGYIDAKKRLFNHQGKGDRAVIGVDDAYSNSLYHALAQEGKIGSVIPISSMARQPGGVAVLKGVIYDDIVINKPKEITLGHLTHLQGEHNAQNIAAAYAAVMHYDLKEKEIIEAIQSFIGLDHRMQYVGNVGDVRFYNDSKATNADATQKALTVSNHIFWILGGVPKAGGITSLADCFSHITHAYLIGQAQDEFAETLKHHQVPYTMCGTLEKAVAQASRDAKDKKLLDSIVLLSPACASFDQFPNFMARGDRFMELVKALK